MVVLLPPKLYLVVFLSSEPGEPEKDNLFGLQKTFGSFGREGRHPSWNTTLLGYVLTRIVTFLACKPKTDQRCSPRAASCIYPHEYLHAERLT